MLPPIKGKNLFNYNDSRTYFIDKYINSSGNINNAIGFITIIIDVKELTNYSITGSYASWNICFFNGTQFISYTNENYSGKFTTPEACNIVKMSSQNFKNGIQGIIVNEGDLVDEESHYFEPYITPSELESATSILEKEIEEINKTSQLIYKETIDRIIDLKSSVKSDYKLDQSTGNFVEEQGKESLSILLNGKQDIRIVGANRSAGIYYSLVKNGEPQIPCVSIKETDNYINCDGFEEIRFGASGDLLRFIGGVLVVKNESVTNLLNDKIDKIYGKNIFDKNRKDNIPGWCSNGTLIDGQYGYIENGIIKGFFTSYYMEVKPNTTYSTSFVIGSNNSRVHIYSNDRVLSRTIKDNTSKTFTTTENEVLLRISAQDIIDTLSIEEGEEAAENTPHDNFKLLTLEEYDDFLDKSNKLDQFLHDVKIVSHLTDWTGLNIAGYGDSITTTGSEQTSDGVLTSGWLKTLGDYFGFDKRYNRGIGGTTIMDYNHTLTVKVNPSGYAGNEYGVTDEMKVPCIQAMSSWSRIKAQFPESIKDTIDAVCFMGGTNDFGFNPSDIGDGLLPKWSASNNYDTEWMADSTYNPEGGDFDSRNSFKGAIASTILKLQRWMPYARIVVVTQLSGRRESKENGMTDFCYDNNGKSPLDYAKDAIMVAQMMSVNYIDLFGTCGINQFNSILFIEDGVHPWGANYSSYRNGVSQLGRSIIAGFKNILPFSRTYKDNDTYE